jgi:hypothetical protein
MEQKKILFMLIQIDEAHSSAWPVGLENQPDPHKSLEDRIERANKFVVNDNVSLPVYVDKWTNDFAEMYRAWPDKYHCIDAEFNIIAKSEYGNGENNGENDALIKVDCLDLIEKMLLE